MQTESIADYACSLSSDWSLVPIDAERECVTLICLLTPKKDGVHSFYVFPRMDLRGFHRVGEEDPWLLSGTRLDSVDQLYHVAQQASWSRQAGLI